MLEQNYTTYFRKFYTFLLASGTKHNSYKKWRYFVL